MESRMGIPEGGDLPIIPIEDGIEKWKEIVARLRVKVKCEKCRLEEILSGMALMQGEVSVAFVTSGPYPGRYYFRSCGGCGYPLSKEVKHYVRKSARKHD